MFWALYRRAVSVYHPCVARVRFSRSIKEGRGNVRSVGRSDGREEKTNLFLGAPGCVCARCDAKHYSRQFIIMACAPQSWPPPYPLLTLLPRLPQVWNPHFSVVGTDRGRQRDRQTYRQTYGWNKTSFMRIVYGSSAISIFQETAKISRSSPKILNPGRRYVGKMGSSIFFLPWFDSKCFTCTTEDLLPQACHPLRGKNGERRFSLLVTVLTVFVLLLSLTPCQERFHWLLFVGVTVRVSKYDVNDGVIMDLP